MRPRRSHRVSRKPGRRELGPNTSVLRHARRTIPRTSHWGCALRLETSGRQDVAPKCSARRPFLVALRKWVIARTTTLPPTSFRNAAQRVATHALPFKRNGKFAVAVKKSGKFATGASADRQRGHFERFMINGKTHFSWKPCRLPFTGWQSKGAHGSSFIA